MTFDQLLVWHAITGRAVDGVAVVTDRLIAAETALSPATVRDTRRGLQAAGMFECTAVIPATVSIDDEITISIRNPEAVTS